MTEMIEITKAHIVEYIYTLILPQIDIKKLGGDMVYGFMQAMDAEKDPRNLIIAFRCACLIAQQFPVGKGFFGLFDCHHVWKTCVDIL